MLIYFITRQSGSFVIQDAREYRTLNSICTGFNVPGLCCLLRPHVIYFIVPLGHGSIVVLDAREYRMSYYIYMRHDTPGLCCLRMGYSFVFLWFRFHFIVALPRGNLRRKGTAFVSYSAEPLSHLQGPALVCEHGQHSWRSPSSYKYVDQHTYCNLGRMRGMLYLLRRPLFG